MTYDPPKMLRDDPPAMADRMTLREHYAGLAMQALVTSNRSLNTDQTAMGAIMLADALIAELAKQSLE